MKATKWGKGKQTKFFDVTIRHSWTSTIEMGFILVENGDEAVHQMQVYGTELNRIRLTMTREECWDLIKQLSTAVTQP